MFTKRRAREKMSEHTTDLTEKTFDASIKKGKWIVDFWAEWCGPCKIMAPHFEAVAKEQHGSIHFGKVDIEANYSLPEKFGVMSVPTTIFFENGEVVHAAVGALTKEALKEMIASTFGK